ncbi:MAG: hypothetical protein OQK25_07540 [Gammaproteobacteria bacterium]|nr:hypothetical protein [Gammaproteobacteria bacterium]
MMKQDRILWIVVAILLIAVVVLLSYIQFFQQKQVVIESAKFNPECQLTAFPCRVQLNSGAIVQLTISPQPVEVMKPLDVRVDLEQIEANRVVAQFNGVGMNMGINRYIFSRHQDGSYRATVTLPICVRNRMDWEAEIQLETDQGIITVPYKFETIKN